MYNKSITSYIGNPPIKKGFKEMAKVKKEATVESNFVTKEQFDSLQNAMLSFMDKMTSKREEVAETVEEKIENAEAKPRGQVAPTEWDEVARAIIGDEYIDHCEMEMPSGGGVLFTVVIKTEKSNMPKEYLRVMKAHRCTKAINNGGIEAIKQYCKVVRQNLKRSEQN